MACPPPVVAVWARDHAAVLRQLAGQISALPDLPDLPDRAQRHADLVGQALADNDPTTLLSPLADTHTHLTATHAGLAAQIQSITDQATQIRHATHATRPESPGLSTASLVSVIAAWPASQRCTPTREKICAD